MVLLSDRLQWTYLRLSVAEPFEISAITIPNLKTSMAVRGFILK